MVWVVRGGVSGVGEGVWAAETVAEGAGKESMSCREMLIWLSQASAFIGVCADHRVGSVDSSSRVDCRIAVWLVSCLTGVFGQGPERNSSSLDSSLAEYSNQGREPG